jgi:hypothetical protein
MNEMHVSFTSEELALLHRLAETALGEVRVEVHRTHHTPAYREQVKAEEAMLRALLEKMESRAAMAP